MTRRLLILLTLFGLACTAQAANRRVPNLHAFEQPVSDASAETRAVAVRKAMAEVLVRLTGNPNVAELPQAQGLLQASAGYVQRFAYTQRVVESDEEGVDRPLAPETPTTQMFLQGKFTARSLDAAIRSAGLPLWSAQRPQVFVAITAESENAVLVLDESIVSAYPELRDTARLRGLPLQVPAQNAFTADDLADAESPLLAAWVEQLEADYLLWGHVSAQADKWVVQAELRNSEGVVQSWRLRSRESGPLLREIVQRSTNLLAERHALAAYTPGGESIVGLWVHGVSSDEQYMRVQQHLQRLPAVSQLSLVAVVGEALVYRAGTESAVEQLDRSIRQAGRLQAEARPPGAAQSPVWTGEYEFHYRLR